MKPDQHEQYEIRGQLLCRLWEEQNILINYKRTQESLHNLEKVIELILTEAEIIK